MKSSPPNDIEYSILDYPRDLKVVEFNIYYKERSINCGLIDYKNAKLIDKDGVVYNDTVFLDTNDLIVQIWADIRVKDMLVKKFGSSNA